MSRITPRPILINELKALARSRRVHLLRILYLAAFLLSLFILLPGLTLQGGTGDIDARLSRIGSNLFYLFVVCQGIGLGILAPALSAGVVAKEKENQTFELLLTTDLGASEIVWHKVASHVCALTILLASAAPVFFVCMIFGGVAAYEVLAYLGFVSGLVLICCGLAAFFSAVCRTTAGSILLTYLVVVCGLFMAPIFCALLAELSLGGTSAEDVLNALSYVNIFICYVSLLVGQMPGSVSCWAWLTTEGVALGIFLGSVILASRLAPKSLEWQPRRLYTRVMDALDRFYEGRWFPAWVPRIHLMDARAPVGSHPILWRECHTSVFGKRAYFVRIALAVVVVAGLIAVLVPLSFNDSFPQMLILWLEHIALAIVLIVCGATAIARERQSRTLGLLLSTPLTARSILVGKIAGILRRVALLVVLIAFHVEVLCYVFCFDGHGYTRPPSRLIALLNTLVFGAFFLVLAMVCSVLCKNATRAILAALFVSLGVILLPVVLGLIIDEFTPFCDGECLFGLSPAYWVCTMFEAFVDFPCLVYLLVLAVYGVAACIGLVICRSRLERLAAES